MGAIKIYTCTFLNAVLNANYWELSVGNTRMSHLRNSDRAVQVVLVTAQLVWFGASRQEHEIGRAHV